MPNPLQTVWQTARPYVTGDYLHVDKVAPPVETKFTPASAEVDWQHIQTLMVRMGATDLGTGDGNSAVFACLMQLALGSIEPPLRVYKEIELNKREVILDHPVVGLLNVPNTFHTLRELRFWKTWMLHCDGNAYFLKMRRGNELTGEPAEIWPISPSLIEPYTAKDSSNYIDGYRRQHAPGKFKIEPVENIIHFRNGIDDRDHRKGLAPIKRLVRQIASDEAATRWTDRMLAIGGAASMMVTIPKDTNLTLEQAEALRIRIEERFTADNVGSVGLLAGGATAERYGFSPSEMDLSAMHAMPETRVCAVIGVHPAIALLGIGLVQTANFASLKEVYTAFTERKLAPMWVSDEETLNRSLMPDFDDDPTVQIMHDLSGVRALQEDVNALWARVTVAYDKGILNLDQTLTLLGQETVGGPDGESRKQPPAPPQFGATPAKPGDQTPPSLPPAKGLSLKQTDLDKFPDMLQALVDLAEPAFTDDLTRYLDRQRRDVKRAIIRNGTG